MTLDAEKQALLERIDDVRNRVLNLVEGLDPELVIHPDSGWCLRDVLAHVTAWQREAVEAGRAHIAGGPELPVRYIPRFNQDAYEESRQLSTEEIFAAWREVYDDLKDVVRSAPTDRWNVEFVNSWGARGTLAELVRSILSHDAEHVAEIRRALGE
jgi:hypothetical protein